MALDVSKMSRNDQVIAGTGIAVLLFSFFTWYKIEAEGTPLDLSFSAWDTNILAKLGVLLCLLAAVWVLMLAADVKVNVPAGPAVIALGLAGLGALLILLTFISAPTVEILGQKVDLGDAPDGEGVKRGLGLILALLAAIAQTAFAAMKFKESGESLPGVGTGTTGSADAAQTPPMGYAAPQPPPPPAGDTGYPPPPAE
jgi:hypothetical protein